MVWTSNTIRRGRNREIEVSRFLFAVEIMLCHHALVYGYQSFSRGAIGVESFLLLSGLLMAHSAHELTASGKVGSIGNASWSHLRKKISVSYPLMVADVLAVVALGCWMYKKYDTRFLYYV